MPTYLYRCSCGNQREIWHGIKESPLIECNECRGDMTRGFIAPAVQFKGSGFYSTDKAKSSGNTPKNN
jgi:putative FmdB family regulatory protein